MPESTSSSKEQREAVVALVGRGWGRRQWRPGRGRLEGCHPHSYPLETSRRRGDSGQVNPVPSACATWMEQHSFDGNRQLTVAGGDAATCVQVSPSGAVTKPFSSHSMTVAAMMVSA